MGGILRNIFSLSVLGFATLIFFIRKVLFFPFKPFFSFLQKRRKEKLFSKYKSEGLTIITFSSVKRKVEELSRRTY